jgi:hypothetical protein
MALGNAAFTQLFATTLQKYEKVLADNVLLTHPTLELFKQESKSQTGRGLVIPLRAANLGATAYDSATGSGGYSTAVSADTIGAAVYDWSKTVITPYRVKHSDILQNTGPEQVVSLVEEYVKGATADHQDFIVAELWSGTASASGDILSLRELIAGTDKVSTTVARTIGGIRGGVSTEAVTNYERAGTTATLTIGANDYIVGDSVVVTGVIAALAGTFTLTAVTATTISYTTATSATVGTTATTGSVVCDAIKDFWKSTDKTIAKSGGGSKDILAAFREVVNAIYNVSRKRPTHIIAGFDVYEEFEAYLQDKGRFDFANVNKAETRFRTIMFDGIEVRLDPDCPVDQAYFIHAPALRFAYLAGEFMKTYPADRIQGTLDEVVPIASTLSVGTSERRAHGKLTRS